MQPLKKAFVGVVNFLCIARASLAAPAGDL